MLLYHADPHLVNIGGVGAQLILTKDELCFLYQADPHLVNIGGVGVQLILTSMCAFSIMLIHTSLTLVE